MALQIPYEFNGVELSKAYARIRSVTFDTVKRPPYKPAYRISVEIFASKEASDAGKLPISGMDFTLQDWPEETKEVETVADNGTKSTRTVVTKEASTAFTDFGAVVAKGGDIRAGAYEFLAARSEFEGATDV